VGRTLLFLSIVGSLVCGSSGAAFARAGDDLPYPLAQAYSTAVRFVRVDRGCKIVDQDPRAAYINFECAGDDSTTHHGALELYGKKVQGRDGVRTQVTLADDPHYDELRFLELYERKLRAERGIPAPLPPPPPPAKHPADGGTSP
jgi:hypothetical protein